MTAATRLAAAADVDASNSVLQEIVVTAQKREQNSQDVGISVSALSGTQVQELDATEADPQRQATHADDPCV